MVKKKIKISYSSKYYYDSISNKYFSGAGIVILEEIDGIWYSILLKDHTGLFSDSGGMYESKHQNLEQTAIEELQEESRNLLIIKNNKILSTYIDNYYPKNNTFYRSYIINITDVNYYDFYFNNNLIDSKTRVPFCWRETTHIKKFKLTELFDFENKNKEIRSRIYDIMMVHKNIDNLINIIPDKINNKLLIINSDNSFLNGTKSWILN